MRPPTSTLRRNVLLDRVVCQQQQRLVVPLVPRTTTLRTLITSSRASASTTVPSQRLKAGYFVSNAFLPRVKANGIHDSASSQRSSTVASNSTSTTTDGSSSTTQTTTSSTDLPPVDNTLLPHRRRQAQRKAAAAAAAATAENGTSTPLINPDAPTADLAPDASSQLAAAAASAPADSFKRRLSSMLSLSKPRLTVLVVLSAMVPYALYPVPSFLTSSALDTSLAPSLSPLTLLFLTTGTTLCSASANALNMLYEPDTDSKMTRTRTRPLVRRLLTTKAAVLFAVGCGLAGTLALYFGVNPTVSFLGAANIALYAGAYTPLKRISAVNTWVGAIVGGIPPLMGWAAAAGESATGDGTWRELLFASDGSSLGGWLFAGLLFAWQFPHFMPLSWGIRHEYKAAGLRMLAWTNPARNGRVALRYSLAFIPLCVGLSATGVTEWSFAVTSLPVNAWLVWEAIKFWRLEGHKGSARGLFWASVWHLPVIMVLALAQKKGMWGRVWRSVFGEPEEEDDGEWIYEDEEEGDVVKDVVKGAVVKK
ncbi:UbiA prenyltransferase family-domain-containing protein [Sordaria brevicollis]|uniref:Protoheme IX farnesyltransferase, mitochondrial n=1 Tax=Sordaria brevicollis TaxID=83679 RepID=A0AAE0P100_SORBR|nr:UbiA prenyltransferase family-domain-containing protein [Sordaria brevicollis]